MANSDFSNENHTHAGRRSRQKQASAAEMAKPFIESPTHDEIVVGQRLRELRLERDLSIRALAKKSGLNFNTLSLIENGKTSPSVSTLQQLANGLEVPIIAFFEAGLPKSHVSYLKAGQRRRAAFAHGSMEDLGAGLTQPGIQPFLVSQDPGAGSGPSFIVHTGLEMVYCLEGQITYIVEDQTFTLDPGDSLLFEAYLPHRWFNPGAIASRSLLVLCSGDERDHPVERHFLKDEG